MSKKRAVHYLMHTCCLQECDCEAICNVQSDEYEANGLVKYVTCKNCLRMIEAAKKRKWKRESEQIKKMTELAKECTF